MFVMITVLFHSNGVVNQNANDKLDMILNMTGCAKIQGDYHCPTNGTLSVDGYRLELK